MATQLSLYNGALREIGERKLASLTESREPRRLLDNVWDNGAINYCLEQGQWNFAIRSAKLEDNPSMAQAFGYAYAFEKPSDFIRLSAVCSDEYFDVPLLRYNEEGGFWFSDLDEIYVKYVSNDTSYGKDYSLWPETFTRYVEFYLAFKIAKRLTQNKTDRDELKKDMKSALTDARSKDAMADPTQFPPVGSWVRSRRGGTRSDRGNRNRLIG